jgi:hypothetical protein
MKTLGIFAWIAISSLVTALIQAAALRRLWSWFVAAEYGPGPSLGAWFGIATILGLIVGMAAPLRAADKEPADEMTRRAVVHTLSRWLAYGLVLVTARLVGSALGWVRP